MFRSSKLPLKKPATSQTGARPLSGSSSISQTSSVAAVESRSEKKTPVAKTSRPGSASKSSKTTVPLSKKLAGPTVDQPVAVTGGNSVSVQSSEITVVNTTINKGSDGLPQLNSSSSNLEADKPVPQVSTPLLVPSSTTGGSAEHSPPPQPPPLKLNKEKAAESLSPAVPPLLPDHGSLATVPPPPSPPPPPPAAPPPPPPSSTNMLNLRQTQSEPADNFLFESSNLYMVFEDKNRVPALTQNEEAKILPSVLPNEEETSLKARPLTKPAANELLAQKRRLKKVNRKDMYNPVSLSRIDMLESEQLEYLPLATVSEVIRQQAITCDLATLSFNSIEQMTDILFYTLKVSNVTFPIVKKLSCTGCPHLTDQGIIWASEIFPNLARVELNGCRHFTEKGLHYLAKNCHDLSYVSAIGTDIAKLPPELEKTKIMNIDLEGAPVIATSPKFSIKAGGRRQFDDGKVYRDLPVFKIVILSDPSFDYIVGSLLSGQPEVKSHGGLTYFQEWRPVLESSCFNILETSADSVLSDAILTPGSIVLIPFSASVAKETAATANELFENLAKRVATAVARCPDIILILVAVQDGSTFLSVEDVLVRVKEKLEIRQKALQGQWDYIFGSRQWRLEKLDFYGQQSAAAGVQVSETLGDICSANSRRFVAASLLKAKPAESDVRKCVIDCLKTMSEIFPWIVSEHREECLNTMKKMKKRICTSLLKIYESIPEDSKKGFSFLHFGKIVELKQICGEALYFPKTKSRLSVTDIGMFGQLIEILQTSKAEQKIIKKCLGPVLTGWSRPQLETLLKKRIAPEELEAFLGLLVKLGYLMPLVPDVDPMKNLKIKKSSPAAVYVLSENLPDQPAVDLCHLWPDDLPENMLQGEKFYSILHGVPPSVLPVLLRKYLKMFQPTLLWKGGILIQNGAVDVLVELRENKHNSNIDIPKLDSTPVIIISGRVPVLNTSDRECVYFVRQCLWSSINTASLILESVCRKYNLSTFVTVPCQTCNPSRNRAVSLQWDRCYHFSTYILSAGWDRGLHCMMETKTKGIRPKKVNTLELIGEEMPSIVPFHNYSYMAAINPLIQRGNSADTVTTGINKQEQPTSNTSCLVCTVGKELVCYHCGLCRKCIKQLAKLECQVKPGFVNPQHTLLRRILPPGKGKSVAEDLYIEQKMTGCVMMLRKGQEICLQKPMTAVYFKEVLFTIKSGTNFICNVTMKDKKKMEYHGLAGTVYDVSGTAHQNDEWICKEGNVFSLRVEDSKVPGDSDIIFILNNLEIRRETVPCREFFLAFQVASAKGTYIIETPGIKHSWQYREAALFQKGMKVKMLWNDKEAGKGDSAQSSSQIKIGRVQDADADLSFSALLRLTPDVNTSTETHWKHFSTISDDLLPVIRVSGAVQLNLHMAPLWLFNEKQTKEGFASYVNMELTDTTELIMPCIKTPMPSVLKCRMKTMHEDLEKALFQNGGVDFGGSATVLLPRELTILDVEWPSQTLFSKPVKSHPLCYVRGDMTSVVALRPSQHLPNSSKPYWGSHILDMDGFEYNIDPTSVDLPLLWAWHFILFQNQQFQLAEYKNLFPTLKDTAATQISLFIRTSVERMCFALFLALGSEFSIDYFVDFPIMELAVHSLREKMLENMEKTGLEKFVTIFGEDEFYMCSAHMGAWQASKSITEVPLEKFGMYASYVKSLHLQNNNLTSLPKEVFTQLVNLMDFDVYTNNICELPEEIGLCTQLTNLTLKQNEIRELPATMVNLQDLDRLDISENSFSEIPRLITQLKSLTRLYAQNMQLEALPDDIGNLNRLTMLYLNGNCFTSLPKSFADLKNVKELGLNGVNWCKLKQNTIMSKAHFEEILKADHLSKWLDRHHHDKSAIFSFFDEDTNGTLDLKELGKLNATIFFVFPRFGYMGTEPPDDDTPGGFPKEILGLESLEYLSMQYQGLVSLPENIDVLKKLKVLNLRNNPYLLSIPAQTGNLPLTRLELDGCPLLKTPPKEIHAKGFATTYAYLRRLLSGSVECQRTKLMLVGLGGAGKTSLVKALLSNNHRTDLKVAEEITDGIDICPWTVTTEEGQVTYSVWDFAGQTVYYNTHQFFLSDRAVYLLLWNLRLGHEHAGLDFWLSSISVHAPKAPIFVVGTHVDQVSKVQLPMKEMKQRYSQIAGFHFISSHTGQGVKELRDNLIDITLKQQYMGEKIPGVWLSFENAIQSLKDQSVIEYEALEKKANLSGIFEKSEVFQAIQFLHELGSLQHFTNEFLKAHVVINPQWIVDVMACVVSVKDSPVKDGRLQHSDIEKVWKDYPANLHSWMLRLTEEFDLTFPLPSENTNLVPCLLPEREPDFTWPEIEKNSAVKETKMIYKFDYLPAGLFNRGQVRLHQFCDSSLIWKRGSFLKKNKHICLILQTRESELVVKAQGSHPENIVFLVHEVFETLIAESFKGVMYDFLIPCPDCLKLALKDPHMFSASTIRRATELQAPFLQCLKYFHTISIIELQAVMPPDSNKDYDIHLVQAVQGLKELRKDLTSDIFLSYCLTNAPADTSLTSIVHPSIVCRDLEKEDYKCWYREDSNKYTMDEMARAIMDSSVFLVFISNDYVKDESCCSLFKYARLILHKPIILIAVGSGFEWKSSRLGILLADEVFVNMLQPERYKHKIEELLHVIATRISKTVENVEFPPCFISYCWRNSAQAVSLGSRTTEGAVGFGDPRAIKDSLEKHGIKCWIDVERVGVHGLFEDIAEGLLNAKVVIACVSDEYASSGNCAMEFRYAINTLKLPVILAVVGTGSNWRASEIGILSLNCTLVNFQEKSGDSMYKLLKAVKDKIPEGNSHQDRTKDVKNKANEEQKNLSFQELYELAQRKFLRQVIQYADSQDISAPYPRLFLVDFVKEDPAPEDEKKDVQSSKPDSVPHSGGSVFKHKFCVHILCEHEEGWHSCSEPLPLPEDFGTNRLEMFIPYITRITAIAKYNKKLFLASMASTGGQDYLKYIEENPQVAATSDFQKIYHDLRQEVIKADPKRIMGKLARCRLPNGKTTWLCEQHRNKMRVTVLGDEVMTKVHSSGDTMAVDPMIQAMQSMNFKIESKKLAGHCQKQEGTLEKLDTKKKEQPASSSLENEGLQGQRQSAKQQAAAKTPVSNEKRPPTCEGSEGQISQTDSKPSLKRQASRACNLM